MSNEIAVQLDMVLTTGCVFVESVPRDSTTSVDIPLFLVFDVLTPKWSCHTHMPFKKSGCRPCLDSTGSNINSLLVNTAFIRLLNKP